MKTANVSFETTQEIRDLVRFVLVHDSDQFTNPEEVQQWLSGPALPKKPRFIQSQVYSESNADLRPPNERKVVPSFIWHPWNSNRNLENYSTPTLVRFLPGRVTVFGKPFFNGKLPVIEASNNKRIRHTWDRYARKWGECTKNEVDCREFTLVRDNIASHAEQGGKE